jgi:hypothetical protein
LRAEPIPLGEIYTYISSLYFRGKLAYAQQFADPPPECCGMFVIVPGMGLATADTPVSFDAFQNIAAVPVIAGHEPYQAPLQHAAWNLLETVGAHCEVVLLGSVASEKYVQPLLEVFKDRLLFPSEFIGRGDMSRGGLLLRQAAAKAELSYVPINGAVRRGHRPPKLPKLK